MYLQHNGGGIDEEYTNFLLPPYEWKKPSKPACEKAVVLDHLYFFFRFH
jgi:hypothetical protein